jgi:hypothetical protein
LSLLGIYVTEVVLDAPDAAPVQRTLPADIRITELVASNLSVAVEAGKSPQQCRLVLRLWADKEGPFDAKFTVVLPPEQEVCCRL